MIRDSYLSSIFGDLSQTVSSLELLESSWSGYWLSKTFNNSENVGFFKKFFSSIVSWFVFGCHINLFSSILTALLD